LVPESITEKKSHVDKDWKKLEEEQWKQQNKEWVAG
jgi:hypothetical protein